MVENVGKPPESPKPDMHEVLIRKTNASDTEAMSLLFRNAFASQGDAIARLSIELLSDETGYPSFGLIAESAGEAVGCVVFSAARIEGCDHVTASILAPLAVVNRLQRIGIGRNLIEYGIEVLRERGTDLVFVLGDPAYYGRHGFRAGHNVHAPFELPYPEAWMIRELTPGSIVDANGCFSCARALMEPEHW